MRHPGIIKLFSAFENEDKLYFSLELLNDGNLLEHINCKYIVYQFSNTTYREINQILFSRIIDHIRIYSLEWINS